MNYWSKEDLENFLESFDDFRLSLLEAAEEKYRIKGILGVADVNQMTLTFDEWPTLDSEIELIYSDPYDADSDRVFVVPIRALHDPEYYIELQAAMVRRREEERIRQAQQEVEKYRTTLVGIPAPKYDRLIEKLKELDIDFDSL